MLPSLFTHFSPFCVVEVKLTGAVWGICSVHLQDSSRCFGRLHCEFTFLGWIEIKGCLFEDERNGPLSALSGSSGRGRYGGRRGGERARYQELFFVVRSRLRLSDVNAYKYSTTLENSLSESSSCHSLSRPCKLLFVPTLNSPKATFQQDCVRKERSPRDFVQAFLRSLARTVCIPFFRLDSIRS